MKKTILTLLTCFLVTAAQAIDTASVISALGSDDYVARQAARLELKQALAEASAPGADKAAHAALEAAVIAQLNSELPLQSRLYLVRMLELFGGSASVNALVALTNDSESEMRDSARRALAAIPGDAATRALADALAKGSNHASYADALAYRGSDEIASRIATGLESDNAAVVSASALALGKLGSKSSLSALAAARKTAPPETKHVIEAAMLDIGLEAKMASVFVATGGSAAVCSGAFQQLVALDPARATEVLRSLCSGPASRGRAAILRHAVACKSDAIRQTLIAALPTLPPADQSVVVATIAERGLSAFEPQVLALLPTTNTALQVTIIDTLGDVGGDASFDALHKAFLADSRNGRTSHALARLKAPSADKKALAAAKSGAGPAARIAAMKLLELRNSPGATKLLNTIAAAPGDAAIKEAAFQSLEKIGDLDSAKLLIDIIMQKGELMRPAQLSLKRLSINLGAAGFLWNEAYKPALDAAADDAARENLVLILDGNDGAETRTYLKTQILNPESGLRDAALKTLARWPKLSSGDTWIEIARSEGVPAETLAAAEKGIKRLLTGSGVTGSDKDKLNLAVKVIKQAPSADFMTSILGCYETLSKGQKKDIKKIFRSLEKDSDVGELVKQILTF